jgi:hypothetical protein
VTPDVVARFEDCTLPPQDFHHEHHIYVAWCYLREMPLAAAADRFIGNLKRYAGAHGKNGLYHDTITWAFLILINERIDGGDWDAFRAANADLFTAAILNRYYRDETLKSERAREIFLLPDRMYEELR